MPIGALSMKWMDCRTRVQRLLLACAGALIFAPQAHGQVFNYLPAPVDVTPGTTNAWVDVDVSAHIPVGATGVILQEVNTDPAARFEYGVRNNGSTDTWMNVNEQSRQESLGFHMIGVDANSIFEVYTEDTIVKTYLLGYTTAGVTFFVNAIDKSISTTGSWVDVDISADTGADTAIGAVFVVKETERSDHSVGLRMKGSTDELYASIDKGDAAAAVIGVDANEVAQMKIDSTFVDLYLVGYVTEGAVFFTNAVNKATATTGSYVDVDITGDIGSDDANGALLALVSNGEEYFAVRPNGATHDFYQRIVEYQWPVIGIDANDILEQKIGAVTHDLYLMGYTLAGGPPPPTISSAANQSFFAGDSATAISTITITDAGGLITAADDIRIRIPAGFNMTWDSADTTAIIGGAAAGKVSTTVIYEDSDGTLVLDVTSNFAAADEITVSGLRFTSFSAASASDNLELEIANDDAVTATDDKTIQIGAPNYRSIGTTSGTLYSTGTASTTAGSTIVTFGGGAVLPADIGAGDKLTFGSGASFSDDFNDATITGWTDLGNTIGWDNMSESGGNIHSNDLNDDCHYTVTAGGSWTDYTVTADTLASDDDDNGLSFRVQDANNYYVFRQRFGNPGQGSWNAVLEKYVGGAPTELASMDNQGSAPGQVDSESVWYNLKVEVNGTNIKCYIDNVLKFNINDSTYASGTAGVWVFSQDGSFDNFSVSGGTSETLYILSRDSDTQVTLQSAASSTRTNETYTIERAYNTLQAWEDDRQGDLVGEGRREIGVAYNDGAFTSPITISGSTTDASHYMMLTVAEGARHMGLAGGGVMIDGTSGPGQAAIDLQDDYTRVEWFEVDNVLDLNAALNLAGDYTLASNMLIHDITGDAVTLSGTGATLRNSVIYDTPNTAVDITAGTATIESNTIYGAGDDGVSAAIGTTVTIRNTISLGSTNYDFDLAGTIAYFGYNMYSAVSGFDPASYQGGNQSPPGDLENLFVSVVSGSEDFHLEPTANRAGNLGLDLSAEFNTDLDGATRNGAWDIGAHEGVAGTEPLSPKLLGWTEIEP